MNLSDELNIPLLEDIVTDTLDSTYVDDDYYAVMRKDLVEFDSLGAVLGDDDRTTYETLIRHENWLLDRRRYEEWFGLLARECMYWVPATSGLPDGTAGDPQTQVSIACDDRRRLADRIVWLRTGVAYSQLPASHTSHSLTGLVRVPTDRAGEVKIRAQFVVHEVRAGHPLQTMSGWVGYVFTTEDHRVRIARKIVCLLDAARSHHNLTFFL
jgi:3-phenylpropionate/cinnamic acid dioxygenase small subunit